jgi:hypothetical protein
MQFSLAVFAWSVVVVAVLVVMDWFKERGRGTTGPRSVSWLASSVVAWTATTLPVFNIPIAISRADTTDRLSRMLEASWGLGVTVVVWAILLAIPAVKRWLLDRSEAVTELERKFAA